MALARIRTFVQQHPRASLAVGVGAGALLILVGILLLRRPSDVSRGDEADFSAGQGAQTVDDWPVYGLDGYRARYLPARSVDPPFDKAWSHDTRALVEFSPIVVDGTLYVVNNDGLAQALDAETGNLLWERRIASLNASSPAFHEGSIYVATLSPGRVVALDAATGKVEWTRALPGRTESSPIVHKGKLLVGCESGDLFALSPQTGKTRWRRQVGGAIKAAPAVSGGEVIVAAYGGIVAAYGIAKGREHWRSSSQSAGLGSSGNFYATPTIAFERIYVGNTDGRMYSFELSSGALAWSKSTGSYVYAAVVAADTPTTPPTIYFGSYDGQFYALDARSGATRWQRPAGGGVSGAASLIGSTVYYANLRKTAVLGLDAKNGRRVFHFRDGAYNPAISDGKRLYLAGKRKIYGFVPRPRR